MRLVNQILFLLLFLAIFFSACRDDEALSTDQSQFIGTFALNGTHEQLASITVVDSMGYFVSQDFGLVTEPVLDTLTISDIGQDSLLLEGIRSQNSLLDLSVLTQSDTLFLEYDQSDGIFVNMVLGKIWIEEDMLMLDYRWRKGTSWGEQFPLYGDVIASGERQ